MQCLAEARTSEAQQLRQIKTSASNLLHFDTQWSVPNLQYAKMNKFTRNKFI